MKRNLTRAIVVVLGSIIAIGSFLLSQLAFGATSSAQSNAADAPQVVRTDAEGKNWGYIRIDPRGRALMPDYIAVKFGNVEGFVSATEFNSGPPRLPNGQPTGASTSFTIRDLSGNIIAVLERDELAASVPTSNAPLNSTPPRR